MKRILGVDLGTARTGVAVSDELQMLAHPVETIASGSLDTVAQRIAQLVRQMEAEAVVVGLPRHMNGSLGLGAEQAQQFAEKLRTTVACKIVTWDERLSSVAAERALQAAGKKTRHSRGIRDQVAAQFILQGYLDSLNV